MRKLLISTILILSLCSIDAHAAFVGTGDKTISQHLSMSEGLSSMGVNSIVSDGSRCLWVGTDDGFDFINNGSILAFTKINVKGESEPRPVGSVSDVKVKDGCGFIASENGLFFYDMKQGRFAELLLENATVNASAIGVVGDKVYAYDYASRRLLSYDPESESFIVVKDFSAENYRIEKIIDGGAGSIIMAESNAGIIKMSPDGNCSLLIPTTNPITASATFLDSKGRIWLADDKEGVYAYSHNVVSRVVAPERFGSARINAIYEQDGSILLASNDGCIVAEGKDKGTFVHGTRGMDISCLCSVNDKDLIVGTRYNGLWTFITPTLRTMGIKNLESRSVLSTAVDRDGRLWFGASGNRLVRFDPETGDESCYNLSLAGDIASIAQLDASHLLLFEKGIGLLTFDMKSAALNAYGLDQKLLSQHSLSHNDNVVLLDTRDGSVLAFNLDRNVCKIKNGSQTFAQIIPEESDETVQMAFAHDYTNIIVCKRSVYSMENSDKIWAQSLFTTEEDILSACIDKDCNVWYVTKSGVWKYTLTIGNIKQVVKDEYGCTYNSVICCSHGDNIWITGNDGYLYCYSVSGGNLKAYSTEDGIPDGFSFRPLSISGENSCYFAGASGVISAPCETSIPALKDEGFRIVCLSVLADKEAIQPKNGRYNINHDYNQVKVRLLVDGPCPTIANNYRYELLNPKGEILDSGVRSEPYIYIGRIPSKQNCVLRVAGFSSDGWQPMEDIATIVRSQDRIRQFASVANFVILLLIAALVALLLAARKKINIHRIEHTDRSSKNGNAEASLVEQKPDERKRAEAIQKAVDATPVSTGTALPPLSVGYHESFEIGLQTALGIIKDQLQSILSGGLDAQGIQDKSENALRQIDQTRDILDMLIGTKDENIKTDLSRFDLSKAVASGIDEAVKSGKFGKRRIIFNPEGEFVVNTNKKVVDNVIRALLFNAYENGSDSDVRMEISKTNIGNIRLSAIDNGTSYSGDYDEIFNGTAVENPFSELGIRFLVNCRSAMEQLGGSLSGFRNVDDGGSTFYVDIPSSNSSKETLESMDTEVGDFEDGINIPETEDFDTRNQTLLFVDDEDDMREFLYDEYKDRFKEIYLAKDGKEGLDIVRSKLPNIIVSDIKMPRMTGFELCKTIKSDIEISHLPVILLTSMDESKSQAIGYKMGADVFIPKPFDSQILYTAMQTLLRNRFEIKKRYSTATLPVITEEQTFSVADESFVLNLNKFINENIDNPDLNVEMLADGLCVSRSTLFNKMNSIIGVSAAKYIKKIRMERAKELLKNTGKSILDIAIEVGFTESQYFSTAFKQDTGMTPSQYRNSNRS